MKHKKYKKDIKKEEKQVCKILREINGLSAETIIERYGDHNAYAIDIVKILNNIGIKFEPRDFSNIEVDHLKNTVKERGSVLGAVMADPKHLTIYYRKDAGMNETRFTLAHELGHCCKTMKTTDDFHIDFRFDEKSTEPNEVEANIFAGELLIPTNKLLEVYEKLGITSLSKLAEKFIVSTNVMKARLEYLGLPYTI